MKFLASLRFRIATLFQRSKMNAEIEEGPSAPTSSTAPMTLRLPAGLAPRQNAAHGMPLTHTSEKTWLSSYAKRKPKERKPHSPTEALIEVFFE
jgi:hypothetical protein